MKVKLTRGKLLRSWTMSITTIGSFPGRTAWPETHWKPKAAIYSEVSTQVGD